MEAADRAACPDPAPHALVKPLAAVDVVLADRRSETARFLSEHYASTVAVEMEAHGFLHGAYINAGLSSLVVRGISDLLTGKTSDTDQRWQPIAARHAAAFTFEVLSGLDPHRRPTADKAWDRLSKHGVRQILLASLATFLIAGGLFAVLLLTSPSYVNLATGSSSGISVAPIRKACDDTPQNGLRSPATTRFSAIRLVYSRVLDGSGIRVYQGTYNGKSYDWLQSDITGNVAMARLTWYMPPHFAYWCDLPIPDKPIRAIPAQVSTVAIPTLVDGKQITFKACIWQSAPFTEGCSSILP